MKSAMKYIAFLLVFTLLAVGTTYVLIQRTNGERLFTPKIDKENEEVIPEAGIDLYGTYDQNHLEFSEVLETVGESNLKYPQIDGLKNAETEALINETIAAAAAALKQGIWDDGGEISYLTYNVSANFSNILGVVLYVSDMDYERHDNAYLTFNLNDGSLLRLEDVLGVQADLLSIVRGAFYENLTVNNLSPEYWESAQSPDEQKLYKAVMGYMAEEEKEFFVSPEAIYLVWDDVHAAVSMTEHAADITLYHKFLSEESLFERDDIGYKNIFTCAQIPQGYDQREFGFLEDNFYYDIGIAELYYGDDISQEMQTQCTAFINGKFDDLQAELLQLGQTARENPDQMYILFACPNGYLYSSSEYVNGEWANTPSYAVSYNDAYRLYQMPKALFDSKYLDLLIAEYRENPYYILMGGLDYVIDESVIRTARETDRLYRYDTGEELTVETLFPQGYDLDTVVRNYAVEEMVNYYSYTLEEAQLQAQGLYYALEGVGLRIVVPHMGEENYLWMPLNNFDASLLNVWR